MENSNITNEELADALRHNKIYKLAVYKLVKEEKLEEAEDPLEVLLVMNDILNNANIRKIQL